jgi:hypothetical protein
MQTPAELETLIAVAAEDGHSVVGATHLLTKNGKITGYASLGGIPLMNVWLDSKQMGALDSMLLLRDAEAILADRGHHQYLMPCTVESPFNPHMERLGFKRLGPTMMHLKKL